MLNIQNLLLADSFCQKNVAHTFEFVPEWRQNFRAGLVSECRRTWMHMDVDRQKRLEPLDCVQGTEQDFVLKAFNVDLDDKIRCSLDGELRSKRIKR